GPGGVRAREERPGPCRPRPAAPRAVRDKPEVPPDAGGARDGRRRGYASDGRSGRRLGELVPAKRAVAGLAFALSPTPNGLTGSLSHHHGVSFAGSECPSHLHGVSFARLTHRGLRPKLVLRATC